MCGFSRYIIFVSEFIYLNGKLGYLQVGLEAVKGVCEVNYDSKMAAIDKQEQLRIELNF